MMACRRCSRGAVRGFSIIELLIVIALILTGYAIVGPMFRRATGTEGVLVMGRLASDVRAAYDLAVLTNRTYRMVFPFRAGTYWLEESDQEDVRIADAAVDGDMTAEEEETALAEWEERMKRYEDWVKDGEVVDGQSEEAVAKSSPVLAARERLRPPKWKMISNLEWGRRSLGSSLMVYAMHTEHHRALQRVEELDEGARGILYFFPSGYVERAAIHVGYRSGGGVEVDRTQTPYTVITHPEEGTATVLDGFRELDMTTGEVADG